jgi:hypothetical protein
MGKTVKAPLLPGDHESILSEPRLRILLAPAQSHTRCIKAKTNVHVEEGLWLLPPFDKPFIGENY